MNPILPFLRAPVLRLVLFLALIPTALFAADSVGVSPADFAEGLRLSFAPFQIFYSLLKATLFGTAIAFFCAFEGFFAASGATARPCSPSNKHSSIMPSPGRAGSHVITRALRRAIISRSRA